MVNLYSNIQLIDLRNNLDDFSHLLNYFCIFKKNIRKAGRIQNCQATDLGKEGKPVRLTCPLNFEALCVLYSYRPMICRLHGIPHEFQNGAGHRVQGPGCETFDQRCSAIAYLKFDRTLFYREMAGLEKEFRQSLGVNAKIRMTIAEMILAQSTGHGAQRSS